MLRKAVVLVVALLTVAVPRAHAGPGMAGGLPEGVVLLVEAADPGSACGEFQALAARIEPTLAFPPAAVTLPAVLFRTGDASVIDLTRPVRLVIMAPPIHTSPVWLCSVTEPDAYLNSIVLPAQGQDGDVHVYTARQGEFAIVVHGRQVAAGRNQEAVEAVARMIREGAFGDEPLLGGGDVHATVRARQFVEDLVELDQNPLRLMVRRIEAFEEQMAERGLPPQFEQLGAVIKAVMTVYADMLEAVGRQVETISVGLSAEKDAVVLDSRLAPVPGGELEAYLAGVPRGELALLRYLPAGVGAFFAGKTGDLQAFGEWYLDMAGRLTVATGRAGGAWLGYARTAFGTASGEAAYGFSFEPGGLVRVTTATALDDPVAAEELLAAAPRSITTSPRRAPGLTVEIGLDVTPDALEHKGRPIAEWQYNFAYQVADDTPALARAAEAQERVMTLVFGDAKKAYSCLDRSNFLYVQGDGALDELKRALDGKGRVPDTDWLKHVLAAAPPQPLALGYVSATGVITWLLDIMREARPGGGVPPGIRLPDTPPITLGATITEDGAAVGRMRIPVDVPRAIRFAVRSVRSAGTPDAPALPE